MTRGRLPYLVDRLDIVHWADRIDARTEFPRVVRGLINATNDQVTHLQMRAAEGSGLPGYDGRSEAARATPFVPAGVAVWELGVGADPGDKAQSDYRARTDNPLGVDPSSTTFVFVTPREWRGKEDWADRRRAERIWANVLAFDVDDIEQALESAPGVHYRFSEAAGKPSHGAQSLDTWWTRFRRLSAPELTPELVLSGRADEAAELLRLLDGSPRHTTISAVSTDEVISFVAAVVESAAPELRQDLLDRALIVKDGYTLDLLEHYAGLLILIPYEDSMIREARLIQGHHVIVRADGGWTPSIALRPVDPSRFERLLRDVGVPASRATDLSRLARRSIEAYQRASSATGIPFSPPWAQLLTGAAARRCWLAAKWDERRSGDIDALAALLDAPYQEAREQFVRLSEGPDPMLLVVGSTWSVVSMEEAWQYGQQRLQPSDLEAFERLIQTVIGAIDPRLELPVEQRWMAAIYGKNRIHSSDLREGIASALAQIGSRGDQVSIGSTTVGSWLRGTMWRLFSRANEDGSGHLWASLSDVLPLLAEAVPDVFLRAVQTGLEGDEPLLGVMFADNEGDALTVSSPHTGLLWALETVAWSPEHFPLAVDLLARLAEVDPGGRLSNRPMSSLESVFRSWLPQTSVGLARRIRVLDGARTRHPEISWRLLLSMLPDTNAVGTYSHAPRFRAWKPDDARNLDPEHLDSFREAAARLVSDAADSPSRWADLSTRFDDLPPEAFDVAVAELERLVTSDATASIRQQVWEPLRSLVYNHRQYSQTEWSMPADRADRLEVLLGLLAPDDVVQRVQWLFDDYMPSLPEMGGLEFDATRFQTAVGERRRQAAIDVIAASGFEGVLRLVASSRQPELVGAAVADANDDLAGGRLLELIDSGDLLFVRSARAWVGRKAEMAKGWTSTIAERFEDRPVARARVLLESPDLPEAWRAARSDAAVDAAFWAEFSPYGLGSDFQEVNEAAKSLLVHGRPRAALALMNVYGTSGGVDPLLVVENLEKLISLPADHGDRFPLHSYELDRLLEIARSADVPIERLGRLEWALRPALGYGARSPVLDSVLARDPEFFVEVLSLVYRSTSDSASADADVPEHLTQNAFQLLHEWKRVPGTRDDGTVDGTALDAWVDRTLALAKDAGRFEIALDKIGKVLASAPADGDGSWPAKAVRNLIERVGRAELDDGFRVQIGNNRGVQSRGISEGGDRERELAVRYNTLAELADDSPRTAAALRDVAAGYEAEARYFDERVERMQEGLGF